MRQRGQPHVRHARRPIGSARCGRTRHRGRSLLLSLLLVMISAHLYGCGLLVFIFDRLTCVDVALTLHVTGVLIDEATGEPLADAPVGASVLTDGRIVDSVAALPDGLYFSDGCGAFDVVLSDFVGVCSGVIQHDDLYRAQKLELFVMRDGCEQQVSIDVNEDTVVDLSFPDNVLELKDSILVPACDGGTQP